MSDLMDQSTLKGLLEELQSTKREKEKKKNIFSFLKFLYGWISTFSFFVLNFSGIFLFTFFSFVAFRIFLDSLKNSFIYYWPGEQIGLNPPSSESILILSQIFSFSLLLTIFLFYFRTELKGNFDNKEAPEIESLKEKEVKKINFLLSEIDRKIEIFTNNISQKTSEKGVIVNQFDQHNELERVKDKVSKFERFINSLRRSNMELPQMSSRNGRSYNRWSSTRRNNLSQNNNADENRRDEDLLNPDVNSHN